MTGQRLAGDKRSLALLGRPTMVIRPLIGPAERAPFGSYAAGPGTGPARQRHG
ncbi:MAG: hypothetical protein R3349_05500 [Geminicoccaceae bacterium]|nr:hypothetical protein [Geminicoccaceae bacterium]